MTMPLSDIFAKSIDRHIEGVIKADDEANLRQEVEEYVLTNEVAKRLDTFLAAYNDYHDANGVWISGFFGSGKSHLLKMLALLFDRRTVGGTPVTDLLLPKIEDALLRGNLQRALAIPSQAILFNIDQKADVISKTELDALLAVFVKVFDEMCGYYGKQGYIAQFEREMDSREQYQAFQDAFQAHAGIPWEQGREQALLEMHNIDAAYAAVTGMPEANARGILDKYRHDYRVSIEDFAEQVNAYLDSRGPTFRLLFCVDEVGQYIADNVKLMTNLQTLAESLATRCAGRAWLLVTAQEDMSTVFGDAGRQQSDDFSKIQDRFRTRMKLTSADIEEVIRKRLLDKTRDGRERLVRIYERHRNNFRTLFDFGDGSQTYRNFRDGKHFVESYPFIPYQYVLFQSAIQSLSQHSAFEGKHSSVGERSMLAVFQQVAIEIGGHALGQLATFDLMFEGIRMALKAQIQRSILTAERHLDDAFAVKVLKALFLVKYVKEFKATARNMTVLMLDDFDADLPALRQRVEQALALLEQQTYVQRTGEEYEYLTDEEKDIEQEIKNTAVDATAVSDELAAIVFDTVIKDRKIRYDENGQDYPFTRKLDERVFGRDYELKIHVISPFHEHAGEDEVLRAHAMGRDELLVIMPPSDRLMRDLLMYKRTEKYVRQNSTTAQQESTHRILSEKRVQNANRLTALRSLVHDLLAEAELVVDARDLEINGSDPKTRIVRGFHQLLERTYPNLRMLRGIDYTQQDVGRFLRPGAMLSGDFEAMTSEAEQEVDAFVQANHRQNLRTTMQSVLNRFEHKPYGWYLAAIQCVVAKLLGRGKLEMQRDSNVLEDEALEHALLNTHIYANLQLYPMIGPTSAQIRALRDFYAEFFDRPATATDGKALGQEAGVAFEELQQQIVELTSQAEPYPFMAALEEPLLSIQEVTRKRYIYYLTELRQHEDALFIMKEQVLDPIRRFMHGAQRQIYDEARRFLEAQDANFDYLQGDSAARLRRLLADPQVYRGDRMQQAKTLLDELKGQVEARVEQARTEAQAQLDKLWTRVTGTPEYARLDATEQAQLRTPFDEQQRSLQRQTLVAVMRDTLRLFEQTSYHSVLRRLEQWAAEKMAPTASAPVAGGAGQGQAATITPRAPDARGQDTQMDRTSCNDHGAPYAVAEIVACTSLPVPFDKPWLADEADVERYIEAVRKALIKAIRDGKRVQV